MAQRGKSVRLRDSVELDRAREALKSLFGDAPLTEAQIISTALVRLVQTIEQRMIPESHVAERVKPLVEAGVQSALPMLAEAVAAPVIVGTIQAFLEDQHPGEHVRVDYMPKTGTVRVSVGDREPVTFVPAEIIGQQTGEVTRQ